MLGGMLSGRGERGRVRVVLQGTMVIIKIMLLFSFRCQTGMYEMERCFLKFMVCYFTTNHF